VGLDWQVTVVFHEERLGFGKKNDSTAIGTSASCTTNTVDVLLAVGRHTDLDDQVDVGEVHSTTDNI
jgi:hypothetical protein